MKEVNEVVLVLLTATHKHPVICTPDVETLAVNKVVVTL